MYHPSNRAILQFCSNRFILLHRPSTKNAGTWRDLSFWPRTKILVFFEVLGLVLNVLKCVLRSEKFSLFWGTLTQLSVHIRSNLVLVFCWNIFREKTLHISSSHLFHPLILILSTFVICNQQHYIGIFFLKTASISNKTFFKINK